MTDPNGLIENPSGLIEKTKKVINNFESKKIRRLDIKKSMNNEEEKFKIISKFDQQLDEVILLAKKLETRRVLRTEGLIKHIKKAIEYKRKLNKETIDIKEEDLIKIKELLDDFEKRLIRIIDETELRKIIVVLEGEDIKEVYKQLY
ncbi:hypothetical protein J7K74_01210, partial [Candidatus Woesearchaeota archaeon]|nr:hypothetical protein [Candidatus Woesearchaeota archaeon]